MNFKKTLAGLASIGAAVSLYTSPLQAQEAATEQVGSSEVPEYRNPIVEQAYKQATGDRQGREGKFAQKLNAKYKILIDQLGTHIKDSFFSNTEIRDIHDKSIHLFNYFKNRRHLLSPENTERYEAMIRGVNELKGALEEARKGKTEKLEQMLGDNIKVGGYSGEETAFYVALGSMLTFCGLFLYLGYKFQ